MNFRAVRALELRFFDWRESHLSEKSVVLLRQAAQARAFRREDFVGPVRLARERDRVTIRADVVSVHFATAADYHLRCASCGGNSREILRAVIFDHCEK